MNLNRLRERHSFREGNRVIVRNRTNPSSFYEGTIYSIVLLPANKHISPYDKIMVDYFYIRFDETVYAKLLNRGNEIIYEHKPVTVDSVTVDSTTQKIISMTSQTLYSYETPPINPNNINAMLIWRDGYSIEAA